MNFNPPSKCQEVEEIRDVVTCAICLELFENAHLLACSHSFCMSCLRELCSEMGSMRTRCPQCRATSVPSLLSLDQLPENEFANKLADLVREQDDNLTSGLDSEELYVGELLEPQSKPKKLTGKKVALAMLKGAAAVASLGLGGIYFGAQAVKRRRRRQEMMAQNPLESFICSNCQKAQIYCKSEVRFKCGMCEDFDLCENCATTNSFQQLHREDHLILKLKFKQRRQLPPGCLLKYKKARDMGEEIDYSSVVHSRAYYHTADQIEWREAISCSSCEQSPIVGRRYKCGMCQDYDLCEACERHSHEIHDKTHVFIVLNHRMKVNIISEPLMKAALY